MLCLGRAGWAASQAAANSSRGGALGVGCSQGPKRKEGNLHLNLDIILLLILILILIIIFFFLFLISYLILSYLLFSSFT